MQTIKHALTGLAAFASLTFAAPAWADAITLDSNSIGDSFTVNFDGFSGGTSIDGLTSSATFTLTGITSTGYVFDYSVSNTTSGSLDSRVSSFAFDVDPGIVDASSTGAFSYSVLSSKYPNGIGTVDVCFKGGDSNSCGGNSGGVLTGDTGTGSLTLGFDAAPEAITISDFFVRYQSISGAGNITSASGAGTISSSSSSSSGGTPVPEPGMIGILGLGLAGLAFARRRPRRGTAHPATA
ncbi:cistern family PEP-CTERM protein [Novosphingobium mathurense]|uniref:PEP-CTERM protein-sorting domain-containing protein/MYXO-CTERM domain-containing protein n=1 Tax=Novosphingobium mathurense TaxID=428990 RepID=A0A1U6GWT0_9SPHN|nr:cistern family PEP-CTERM protein [Novosphingobium mathurense]SLJ87971.1 PEP-CTERM protein-sorting domain-containing protein/MYXO-CTERM domain-containing protein [Novosphingobium mathurense]